jgi:hypothetical protein
MNFIRAFLVALVSQFDENTKKPLSAASPL